ncbi:MAG: restriction endonuclease subunit S [Clostridia bacterium]|nr:restriction endonuclease subunit S [Clostridia bacterium]
MRAMKDSGIEWIGAIPQNWELRKIKTNFDIIAGATPKSGEASFWDGDIPWITPADYTTEGVYVSAGHKSITQDGLNSCATSLIPEGSIIFSKRAPVGLVAINSNSLCTNQGCLSCVPKDSVDAKYYYYVMSIYGEQFDLFASGTTFKEISADAFANFKLPYPDYETQKRITSFLDTKCAEIDALIAAKEKTNALLKERRQSIIYEAVTKGLDPTVPMKDSGVEWIGEIPEGWKITALKRLGTPATGSTPSKDNADYWDGDIPWVSSKDIKSDYLLDSEDHITQTAVDECGLTLFSSGALIFCVRSGILRHTFPVAVATIPVTINQDLRSLSMTGDVNPAFVLYYMRGMNDIIVRLYQKIGATVESIEMDWFLYFPVVLPTREEQDRIVEALDSRCTSLDHTVMQNEATIRQLKEYRQSLIYEAITGKIEV